MARRRFFVDQVRDARAELRGEEARHLAKVLRAEPGQRFELSDNRSVYLAEVAETAPDCVVFRVLEPLETGEPPVRIILLAALIKFDRFEWMIEKATELGVDKIVPVEAARSEKGLREAAHKRIGRWRKIVREASQQARRARTPEIEEAGRLEASLALPAEHRYVLEEEPGAPPLLGCLPAQRAALDTIALLVGPEGGWSEAERSRFAPAGWWPVSLGPNVLRAETAAAAAVALVVNAWLQ